MAEGHEPPNSSSFSGQRASQDAYQHNGHIYNTSHNNYYAQSEQQKREQRVDASSTEGVQRQRIQDLGRAAYEGQAARVRRLIRLDDSLVDSADELGLTATHHAALGGHEDVVEELYKAGADINTGGYSGTPLCLAALKSQAGVVKLLLKHKANARRVTSLGTAFHCAAYAGSLECMNLLLGTDADSNVATFVAIEYLESIYYENVSPVPDKKSRRDLYGPWGRGTPAAWKGTNRLQVNSLDKAIPAFLSIWSGNNSEAMLKLLGRPTLLRPYLWDNITHCSIHWDDMRGFGARQTVASVAVLRNDSTLLDLILQKIESHWPDLKSYLNDEPGLSDGQFKTALQLAAMHGNADMVRVLCHHGADVNFQSCGTSAMSLALKYQNTRCVQVLQEFGACVDSEEPSTRLAVLSRVHSGDNIRSESLDRVSTAMAGDGDGGTKRRVRSPGLPLRARDAPSSHSPSGDNARPKSSDHVGTAVESDEDWEDNLFARSPRPHQLRSTYKRPTDDSLDFSKEPCERLETAQEAGYQPEGNAGTSSTPRPPGHFSSTSECESEGRTHSGQGHRSRSLNHAGTVMAGDKNRQDSRHVEASLPLESCLKSPTNDNLNPYKKPQAALGSFHTRKDKTSASSIPSHFDKPGSITFGDKIITFGDGHVKVCEYGPGPWKGFSGVTISHRGFTAFYEKPQAALSFSHLFGATAGCTSKRYNLEGCRTTYPSGRTITGGRSRLHRSHYGLLVRVVCNCSTTLDACEHDYKNNAHLQKWVKDTEGDLGHLPPYGFSSWIGDHP
ncbi:hypothetical protein Q7P37_005670 [Cladosporium fusiforme]